MKKRVASILALAMFLQPLAMVFAADEIPSEDLSAMVARALAQNPELKASDARWRMFTEKIARASSFEDPMLMLAVRNGVVTDPFNFGKEPMTGKVIGISQQIPFWGKRGLKGEVAAKEAEVYRWSLEERKVELTRMVKEAWYRIYYIDRSREVVDRNIGILDDFITLAETKYSVNKGSQTDILKAQVERSKLLEARITLEQERRSAVANLNSLLYRPTDTPLGRVPDFELKPVGISEKELRDAAFENRPQIKSLIALVDKGEAGLKLADKEFYPDFNVFAEYMQRDPAGASSGDDMYSVGVSFNLPVQRARRHAAVAEANAETEMAKEELSSLKNGIDFGIADLLAKMEKRKKLVELYRSGIIPQAEQALESATINYRVNRVDFLTLLDSQMTLFNYQREYYDSMAGYGMRRAELEALVGKDL